MKALYLETSALARAYVEKDVEVHEALQRARRGCQLFTSALTEVEMRRAVLRLLGGGKLSSGEAAAALGDVLKLLAHADVLPLGQAVLARAGDVFPGNLRSLDALHVATAVLVQHAGAEQVVMFSRDNRVRQNAAALGMVLA